MNSSYLRLVAPCTTWRDCQGLPRSQCYDGVCACIADFGLTGSQCDKPSPAFVDSRINPVNLTGGTQQSRSVTLAALINIFAATCLVYLHINAMDKKRIGLSYNLSFTVSSVVAIVTGAGQMALNLLLSSGRGTSDLYYSSTGLYCLLQVVYSTTCFWSVVVVPATWIGELLDLRLLYAPRYVVWTGYVSVPGSCNLVLYLMSCRAARFKPCVFATSLCVALALHYTDTVNKVRMKTDRLIPTRAIRLLTPLLAFASLALAAFMSLAFAYLQRLIVVVTSVAYIASIQILFYVGAQAVFGRKKSALRHILWTLQENYCCFLFCLCEPPARISPESPSALNAQHGDSSQDSGGSEQRPKRSRFKQQTLGFRQPKLHLRRSLHDLLSLDRLRRHDTHEKYSRPSSLSTIQERSSRASLSSDSRITPRQGDLEGIGMAESRFVSGALRATTAISSLASGSPAKASSGGGGPASLLRGPDLAPRQLEAAPPLTPLAVSIAVDVKPESGEQQGEIGVGVAEGAMAMTPYQIQLQQQQLMQQKLEQSRNKRAQQTEDGIASLALHMWFLSSMLLVLQCLVQSKIGKQKTALGGELLYNLLVVTQLITNTVCLAFCSKKVRRMLETLVNFLTGDTNEDMGSPESSGAPSGSKKLKPQSPITPQQLMV